LGVPHCRGEFTQLRWRARRLRHLFIDVLVEKGYIVKMVRQPQHDRILLFISTPVSLLLAEAEKASADFTLTIFHWLMFMGPCLTTLIAVFCCQFAVASAWMLLLFQRGCWMSGDICFLLSDVG
jgi:hypothetical protein